MTNTSNDLELARQTLRADSLTFAIAKAGAILRIGRREGISELLEAIDALGDSAHGASLADEVVGKAVAMVARAARMRAVYSPLASQAARDALAFEKIEFEYDHLVPLILNKRSDGPCPMEQLTLSIDDPPAAIEALREFVRKRVQPA
jgi:hypothetical protein